MVCTHHGISGPAVFAFSAKSAYETMSRLQPLELTVDLIPSLSKDALQEALLRLVHEHPKQHPVNLLRTWLPHSVSEMVAAHIKLPAKASCEVKHDVWRHLSAFLKAVPLSAHTRGAGDEFVTAGGVSLAEVDPRSMESKLCPGLFFAGEILDVDGVTGGFNLQASWATGRLAGESASR